MNNIISNAQKKENKWNQQSTYEKISEEISTNWPHWKKEAYNEMFAISTHATKIAVNK